VKSTKFSNIETIVESANLTTALFGLITDSILFYAEEKGNA
jgi:hypothetical protein